VNYKYNIHIQKPESGKPDGIRHQTWGKQLQQQHPHSPLFGQEIRQNSQLTDSPETADYQLSSHLLIADNPV